MQLGISTYSYTWAIGVPGQMPDHPMSAFDLLDKAHEFGIHLVQFADNLPLEKLSEKELDKLKGYASSLDISIEMGGRGLSRENTLQCLNAAVALSSPVLRMVIDGPGFTPSIGEVIEIIKETEALFRKNNVRLAIENHDRFKACEFELMVKSVGSEFVGICLDSVNSMGAGEGFENVSEILIPYTINLHLKDFTIRRPSHKMGFLIEGTSAGKGMLNIPDLIERLKKEKKCQSAILELWTSFQSDLNETIELEDIRVKESISYLKTIFENHL